MTFDSVRLYQIPWSHFCDKIRWALDLKNLPIERIFYSPSGPTTGLERAPKTLVKLSPIIEDPNNKDEEGKPIFLSDSTPILLYLDEKYSPQGQLFPIENRQEVLDFCLQCDSILGPFTRRLAYVQILDEYPQVLCLTQSNKYTWALNPEDFRSGIVARVVACFLIARFRLHRVRQDQVREKLDAYLLPLVERLKMKNFLVGETFTAADLTFCALFKPLEIIPSYRNDERFSILFDYHRRIRDEFDLKFEENLNLLEKLFHQHREKLRNPTCWLKTRKFFGNINFFRSFCLCICSGRCYGPSTDDDQPVEFSSKENTAKNDQRNLNIQSKCGALGFFFKYNYHRIFTMPSQFIYLRDERNEEKKNNLV